VNARRAILVATLVALAVAVAYAARPVPETGPERVERIAAELRCPVCQGLSAKDSPSETARAMRDLVAQRVAEGRSDDEIRAEFRRSYGDWVLLSPPLAGGSALVWLIPPALLAAGLLVLRRRIREEPDRAAALPDGQVTSLRERVAREEALEG
jgi:cytochrome c-type biogenesis protein CcmH